MRLYFDQMLRVEVADALRQIGHDVVRATRTFANRLVIVDLRKERWITTENM